MIRRPRALLFDLDGTLVDSRHDIAAACNVALVAHGLPTLPLERILPMVGDGARALAARAFFAAAERPGPVIEHDPEVEAVLVAFAASYLARPCVHTVLLPGAREILEEAQRELLSCALVTNKPRKVTLALLDALGMAGAFTAIWAGGDGPLKPAPDGVLAMTAALAVPPRDVWMIGDGPQDIGAGKAAGCVTVGVPGIAARDTLVASAPDVVFESLYELSAQLGALVFTADRA